MSFNINKFNVGVHVEVIKAYLTESKSHRKIQEDILKIEAPKRGGGFVAMEILHYYGITGKKKGVLITSKFEDEYAGATGSYKQALELIKGKV
jgi:uncharacterized protein (DUF488 family)